MANRKPISRQRSLTVLSHSQSIVVITATEVPLYRGGLYRGSRQTIDFKKKMYRGLLVRGCVLGCSLSESKGFASHDLSRLTVGCTFLFLESYTWLMLLLLCKKNSGLVNVQKLTQVEDRVAQIA